MVSCYPVGNRPDSPHFSTPNRNRTRRKLTLSLSSEASNILSRLAVDRCLSRSRVIELMLLGHLPAPTPMPEDL